MAGEPGVSLECLAAQGNCSRGAGHDEAEALTSDKNAGSPWTPTPLTAQHPG